MTKIRLNFVIKQQGSGDSFMKQAAHTIKSGVEFQCLSGLIGKLLLIFICLPGMPISLSAQGATAALEEVVVTARRRQESLQETPIAVSAFSAADLEERSLNNLMDIGSYAPNVIMATGQGGSGGANNGQIYIRGIGQSDFLFTTDPGVGIYIDGVFHPRTLGASMDLMDLERVEVLRGPQGTLFGKNTVGGAVNVVSAKPTGETGGYAEAKFGRFDRTDFKGGIDFSVIEDTLFAKAAISYKNRDGFMERRDFASGRRLDRSGSEDQIGGRIALRWLPSSDVSVDIAADYSHWDQESVANQLVQFDDAGAFGGLPTILWNALIGGPSGTPISSAFVSGDPDVTFGTGPNDNDLDAWGINATVEWDMGWATLKSITAYREMEAAFGRDGDGSPLPIVHTDQVQDQDQFTQEIQLLGTGFDGRLNWVAGFFYFDEFGRDRNEVVLTSGLFGALEGLPGQLSGAPCAPPFLAPGCAGNPINPLLDLDFDIFNEIDITSIAMFSQGTLDFTEKFSLTLGIRYTYESKEYALEHRRPASNTFIVPLTTVEESWTEPTYTASLQYQWHDDLMTYVTYSHGFKSGGFNGRPTVTGEVSAFDPEFLNSYEIGMKSEWLDRRLRLNVAAFVYDYDDLQFGAVTADSASGSLLLVIDNVAAADVSGVEIEVQALPFEGLDVSASVGYTDFEISGVDAGVADVTLQTEMIRTPKWSASASAEYTFPEQSFGLFRLRGDWTYESESFADIQNTPSIARESHSIINARLTWDLQNSAWAGEGWQLAVFGTNLTDRRVLVSGLQALNSFGTAEGHFNRPREWGVSIRKSF
ncbi:MAG: TonB-dependent receptor [Gammaproteobacteria bacterium]|nr:TonB-dependent receptor [Gammaproteobacteria bacterium]